MSKVPPACWTILGILFTSILAPVGVQHFDDARRESPPVESPPAIPSVAPLQNLAPSVSRIRAKGTGSTAEAAFQSAMDAALQQAVATEVSAADWRLNGPTYLASLRQDGTGVVRGWHEVSSSSERRLTGRVFQSEVVVEVDVKALRARLHSAGLVSRR